MLSDLNTHHYWGFSERFNTNLKPELAGKEPIHVKICMFCPLLDEVESWSFVKVTPKPKANIQNPETFVLGGGGAKWENSM
jgi:hypothetical protein